MTDNQNDFELEAFVPGEVPARVIDELLGAFSIAKDYSLSLGDAIKAQAEKYKIEPRALRKYVAALAGDKVKDAEKEASDLQALIATHRAPPVPPGDDSDK